MPLEIKAQVKFVFRKEKTKSYFCIKNQEKSIQKNKKALNSGAIL